MRVDRAAEAHNLNLAADLGLALPAVYCDVQASILVTRAVAVLDRPPADLARQLGTALGRLHDAGPVFRGRLDPDDVIEAQGARLQLSGPLLETCEALRRDLRDQTDTASGDGRTRVPSHGDPSPGNCLATADGFWLIDWEFSAMAEPAWDLAYAILEHGLSEAEEAELLEGYCASRGEEHCPTVTQLKLMKAKCDTVSAFWALEQVQAGRDAALFEEFARVRIARARRRLKR